MTDCNSPTDGSATALEPQFRIADDDGTVTVGKFRTKRGERAEITTGSERIRLDALILESISWQRSREALAARIQDGNPVRTDPTPLAGGEPIPDSSAFEITNEYAQVELCHVRTDAGEALRIRTPARGSETNLGAGSLRALACHDDTFAFSAFFETPVGPEDTPVEGPH